MTSDDRLMAAFLELALADRPELAALQPVHDVPTIQPLKRRNISPVESKNVDVSDDVGTHRQNLQVMLAEQQAANAEKQPGEEGWANTRMAWPSDWFGLGGNADIAACRRMWATALLAMIRDVVQQENNLAGFDEKRDRKERPLPSWIGSKDFHEVCALAGFDGEAICDRLNAIHSDPEMVARILRAGTHQNSSGVRA